MLFLIQDGITNGAIYALLGLALVLVFAVTRVILIPQGEFVTYGALTYASLSAGQMPGTAKLAVVMGVAAFAFDLFVARRALHTRLVVRAFAVNIVLPSIVLALTMWLAGRHPPIAVNIALSLVIVAAIGLFLYRLAFQPIAHTSVLVLLIASVGCHLALQGLGLLFFGAEGQRGPTLADAALTVGPLRFTGQKFLRSTVSPSPSSSCCGCSLASPFTARRCAPPRSTGSARGSSASAPRCRARSRSCSPP